VPQFCGGTAVQDPILGALEANKLVVLRRYVKDVVESSLLEHYEEESSF
jgi:hypothetical protein